MTVQVKLPVTTCIYLFLMEEHHINLLTKFL